MPSADPSAPPAYTGVYVFGDSLVDSGNDLGATQALSGVPFLGVPVSAPTAANGYVDGRFSNGWNFADLISNKLLHEPSQPTFPFGVSNLLVGVSVPVLGQPFGDNLNFAYGGALAVGASNALPPTLATQVAIYDGAYRADPNALYVVSIGGNDIRALVPDGGAMVTGAAADQALAAVATEIAADVGQLIAHGARHVLVVEVPDVGLTPEYLGAADETTRRSLATQYSQTLDSETASDLAALSLPAGASVVAYSSMNVTSAVVADPAAHGFTDVTHAQLDAQPGDLAPTGGFLFFDGVHPTAQGHAQIAASILAALSGTTAVETEASAIGARAAAIVALGATDSFTANLVAGHAYVLDALGVSSAAGTLADPVLTVVDGSGAVVAEDDDSGLGLDSHLTFTPTSSGAYTIEVSGVGASTGSFDLQVGEQGGANLLQAGQLQGSNESVTGGAGDDVIVAASGTNFLRGGDGDDSVQGGSGFDDINGNKGDDTIDGGSGGADWLVGGQGNDLIEAHASGNILYGNLGNDTLSGGSGDEILRGGQGDDVISGGAGNDWLSGDRGSDTLTGGAGADTFHTFAGAGVDVVTDFNATEGDRVQLDAGTSYTASQVGADVHIDLSSGDEMVLRNVTLSTLPSSWIFTA